METHVVGDVIVSLAVDARGDKGASWIKIAPRGRVECRDGRAFSFDPEALAARFAKDGINVPVDFDHSTILLAAKGQRSDAIGWIDAAEARPDGLWGRVEWLETGKAALAARTHRYVSPTFPHDATGNARYLHSVALVTAPALGNMPALASAGGGQAPFSPVILSALALPDDATEAQALERIGELRRGLAGAPKDGAVMELMAQLAAARHGATVERIAKQVDDAIRAGTLLPALRDWSIRTASADEKGFTALLAAIGTPFAYLQHSSGLDGKQLSTGQEKFATPAAERIAAQLGIDPAKLA